jgi:cyanophycin synthetase
VMGTKIDNIRVGLRTFDTTFFQAPGRLNVFDELPFKVILDYGHNPAAVAAMAELVERMEVPGSGGGRSRPALSPEEERRAKPAGKRICVLAAPGDRRDEDILAIARGAAPAFEQFILRSDDSLRGRKRGEVTGLLREGLLAAGVAEAAITVIEDEQEAVLAGLQRGERGDLLVIFGDDITRCWKQVIRFGGGEARPSEVGGIGKLAVTAAPVAASPSVPSGEVGTRDEVEPVRDERPMTIGRHQDVIVDERGVRLAREHND